MNKEAKNISKDEKEYMWKINELMDKIGLKAILLINQIKLIKEGRTN